MWRRVQGCGHDVGVAADGDGEVAVFGGAWVGFVEDGGGSEVAGLGALFGFFGFFFFFEGVEDFGVKNFGLSSSEGVEGDGAVGGEAWEKKGEEVWLKEGGIC